MKRLILAFAFVLPLLVPTPAFPQANLLGDLVAARANYPTPMSPAQLAALLNDVAWKHKDEGWGLLAKPSGNNCPAPSGVAVSCDFLVFAPTGVGFDVLTDSDNAARPQWGGGESIDRSRFVAPVQPAGGSAPPQNPPPPPPVDANELAQLKAAVEDLKALVERAAFESHATNEQLTAIAARPIVFPTYTGRIFNVPVVFTPK